MKSFLERGWLSESLVKDLGVTGQDWWKSYKVAIEISEFSWQLQLKVEAERGNVEQLLAATLFARLNNLAQLFLLTAPRGMRQELNVLIRCVLEPLFPLVAISKDKTFANRFILSEEIERNKKLKKLKET